MSQTEKNLKAFIEALQKEESELRSKANYCFEHKFNKDADWLRMKATIVQEIRFEAELISGEKPLRPMFNFKDKQA